MYQNGTIVPRLASLVWARSHTESMVSFVVESYLCYEYHIDDVQKRNKIYYVGNRGYIIQNIVLYRTRIDQKAVVFANSYIDPLLKNENHY